MYDGLFNGVLLIPITSGALYGASKDTLTLPSGATGWAICLPRSFLFEIFIYPSVENFDPIP
jgi:hypothetical protein